MSLDRSAGQCLINDLLETVDLKYEFVPEFERRLVTRYRTESHNFNIESVRLCNPTIRSSIPSPLSIRLPTARGCTLLLHLHNHLIIEEALTSPDAAKMLI